MVKFGAHAFVWIGEWTTGAGNHAIAEAGRVGFDLIEIPLLDPDNFDAAAHRAALDRAWIACTCSLVLPGDAHMPAEPEKARAFLYRALAQAEAVGSHYLCGCIAYSLGTLTGKAPTPQERQIVVETLAEVAEDAKRRGITLGLEVCNRYETYLYNTLEDGQAVVKALRALGYDNIELHGDTYHMNIEEEGFYKPIVACAETLGYIHMSESHRWLVCTGTVIWDEVWRGLADAHFDGHLVLESFAAINPALAAATCLWRPPNQGPQVLAGEGYRFLRAGAEKYGLL